jgi:hypothetical protein
LELERRSVMGVFDKAKDKVEDLAKDRMGGNDGRNDGRNDTDNPDQNQNSGLRDKADDAMRDVKDRFNNN